MWLLEPSLASKRAQLICGPDPPPETSCWCLPRFNHCFIQAERFASRTSPASSVTSAVLHAVTSAHPKTRYLVGNVDGWPAVAHYLGAHLLPDRLLDRLILRVRQDTAVGRWRIPPYCEYAVYLDVGGPTISHARLLGPCLLCTCRRTRRWLAGPTAAIAIANVAMILKRKDATLGYCLFLQLQP